MLKTYKEKKCQLEVCIHNGFLLALNQGPFPIHHILTLKIKNKKNKAGFRKRLDPNPHKTNTDPKHWSEVKHNIIAPCSFES